MNVFEVLFFVDEFHRFAIHNANETIFETKQAERKTRLVLFFVFVFYASHFSIINFIFSSGTGRSSERNSSTNTTFAISSAFL